MHPSCDQGRRQEGYQGLSSLLGVAPHRSNHELDGCCRLARGSRRDKRVKLTEAFIGATIAGAERGSAEAWVIIHRSRGGVHLSRYTTAQGQRASHLWTFPSLYELLRFAQTQGFTEVDPAAEDWRPVFTSP